MNSRYLMFEAQQAHYYGLNPALALASVTATPAKAAGLDHRVGTIAEGLLFALYPLFIKAHIRGDIGYDAGTYTRVFTQF
jgi:alpha-D-ribose 1-methylphosphonate 5-triphosphate diphosphatase PhnM